VCLCVLTIVGILVIGVLVFTVFCIGGIVFLYCFVYVCIYMCVLSGLVSGLLPPGEHSIAVTVVVIMMMMIVIFTYAMVQSLS